MSNKTWDLGQQEARELQVKRQCSTACLVSPNGPLASGFRANIYGRFSSSTYVLYGPSFPQFSTWSPYHIWWREHNDYYPFVLHFFQHSVTSSLSSALIPPISTRYPKSTHRNKFLLNNQPDALIIQIYSVIKLYVFWASSLPIIRSFLPYIRHW